MKMDTHWQQHRRPYPDADHFVDHPSYGPDVYWVPHQGARAVPIHVFQLRESLQAAEAKLAAAQYAFAREKEELLTTIAGWEHATKTREAALHNCQSELRLRIDELDRSRQDAQRLANESSRLRDEYSTKIEKNATQISALQATLERCESTLAQTELEKVALNRQLLELAASKTFRECDFQRRLDASKHEVARLQSQLDETETQHRSDVESYSQLVAELRLVMEERDRLLEDQELALDDLSTFCDRRECEADDARRYGFVVDAQLSESQDRVASLQKALTAKQCELDDFAVLADSLESQLAASVQQHSQQSDAYRAAIAAKDQESALRVSEMAELKAASAQREIELQECARLELERANEKSNAVIQQLQDDLRASGERESRHEAIAGSLQHRVDELSAAIKQHEAMIESHEITIEDSQRLCALRESELAELKAALAQREIELQEYARLELERANEKSNAVIQQLQDDLRATGERESRHEAIAGSLQHRVDELSAAIQQHEALIESHEITIDDFQRLCAQRESELADAGHHSESIGNQLEILRVNIDGLHSTLAQKQAEIEDAGLRRNGISSELASANGRHLAEVESLQAKISDAELELVALRQDSQRHAQLRESMKTGFAKKWVEREAAFDQMLKELHQAAELKLTQVNQQHAEELQRQHQEIEELKNESRDGSDQLHQREQSYIAERATLEQTHASQLAVLLEKLQCALKEVSEIDACRSVETRDLADSKQAVNRLQQQIADLTHSHKKEQERIEVEASSYLRQIESMREQLASETATVASRVTECQELSCQVQRLEACLSEAVNARRFAESEIVRLESELTRVSAELQQTTAEAKIERKNLISLVNVRTAIANEAIGQARELRQQFAKQKAPNPPATDDQTVIERYRQHVERLSRMYEQQQDRCQRAEFAVTQLERQIDCLNESTSTLRNDLQREAAARRKAEAAIKGFAGAPNANEVSVQLSAQIELDEQVKRLTSELESTRKLFAIERQQAEAEVRKQQNDGKSMNSQTRAA